MISRVAFLLFAGPEMPCKLQHAFLFARDVARAKGTARVIFEGNSAKWLPELQRSDQPMHALYNIVRDEGLLAGVCKGCATEHGVVADAEAMGLPLLGEAFGHVSLIPLLQEGFEIVSL